MTEILPDSIQPYTNISSKAYEHPADRAATAALKSVPMLDTVVRRLIEWRYERALRQFYLGNSVKVGERQLPELWAAHVGVCRILDMPEVYDLYVTYPVIGRRAGDRVAASRWSCSTRCCCSRLGPGEQRAVLAPRARAHPVRPHDLHDRAQHPAERRQRPPVPARDPVPSRQGGAARVVPRRPS